ncbi:GNAT family N-acetyltransferase [Sporosarcina luteola]|uniref:GNAT family N-acetyltransferase n=1 Tax=Sporosarcina luteola TaxID=582850 RepID=UPI0020424F68|nr:GNAT family N-acetyltransferase [Sporosarcina luteola]MCM3745072.1 GNAT family N-acetyltransferase [Sporosarcina luteola]
MTFPELQTDRLHLVEVTMEHAQGIFENFSNPAVLQYYGMDPMTELAQAEKLVEHFRNSFLTSHSIRWAMIQKEDNRFAGTIGLNNLSKGMKRAEVGFEIHPDFWRTGMTSEALKSVLDYSFSELGLHRLGAVTFLDNVASINLLKKHGFVQEGILRSYLFQNGQSHDARVFSVLKNQ